MDRKQFLGTLFVLPAGIFLVHCSSDSSTTSSTGGSGGTGAGGTGAGGTGAGGTGAGGTGGAGATLHPPAAPPTQSGGMDIYTSSDDGTPVHHHTFTLADTDISSPTADVTGDTSTDSQHSHTVAITAAQLAMVGMGQMVQVVTGVTSSHTHYLTFVKIG